MQYQSTQMMGGGGGSSVPGALPLRSVMSMPAARPTGYTPTASGAIKRQREDGYDDAAKKLRMD